MKIVDYFNDKQKEKVPEGAVAPFQTMLDLNIKSEFQERLQFQVTKMLERTGSCVLIPNKNCPPLCREGVKKLEEDKTDGAMFIPIAHNVFGVTPNPGDPVIFCIIANASAGIMFEWEHLWDLWRRGKIELPHTTSEDMNVVDRHVRREMKRFREYHAKKR